MKIAKKITSILVCSAFLGMYVPNIVFAAAKNNAPLSPTGLLINELENPLNVEEPEFSWLVNDTDYNEIQTAYEIVVTDGLTGDIAWDSGKVLSSDQSYVKYSGDELNAGYPYTWKVKTWDKDGEESPYSSESYFATGINNDEWSASWISDGKEAKSSGFNHFWYARYETELDSSKEVSKALAYFSTIHDYDLYINGEEIGRGQSFDYESETRYQGWDITDAVKADSRITAGVLARNYGNGQGRAAGRIALLGQINIYYTDGTSQTITTNGDWKVSTSVPFSGTTTRNGEGDFVENYNAQNAQDGFSEADFDDSGWNAATVIGAHPLSEDITSVQPELSKITSYEVHPISVVVLSDGTTVADFGQVIPARPEITFKNGKAGNKYTIQTGYTLDSSGGINSSSRATQDTNMTFVYTQKDGEQTYSTWDHLAFRYMSIPACGEVFTTDTIAARVVHTDVPKGRDSTLKTSNEMLNSVYELMKRSALYSIQNSFVDTPTREKGQFLQDSINISEASISTLYERAASKKAIEQFLASADRYWNDGRYNSVYPNGDGKRDIPDFTINLPYWVWNYYMVTGDRDLLEQAYPYIKTTADYISNYISSSTGLVTQLAGGDGSPNSYQYGIVDWPASGRFGYDWANTKSGARTTVNMLSKRAFDVVAAAAEELGYTTDAADMQSHSEDLKVAINDMLINSDGVYCDGLNSRDNQVSNASQHATSYALAFDVAPEEKKEEMSEYVAGLGMRQGPMTADILVKALMNSDRTSAALKLLTEPNDYGWAKEVANDYTFTFEEWGADTTNNSQSHGWGTTAASDILKGFAGVTNLEPGASRIKIAPLYADLTSLNASVSTQRGAVLVSYERAESNYDIKITVPANVTAEIELPVIGDGKFVEKNGNADEGNITDVQTINVGSGSYEFIYSGNINIQPEKVEYDTNYDSIIYSLADLDYNTFIGGYVGDYEYNDMVTLHFGGGSSSISNSGNGFDMYNDGSYIAFTPDKSGIISLEVKMRKTNSGNSASTLYISTTGTSSGGESLHDTVSTDTELVISDIVVEAGTTYYLYNNAGRPTSIKSITYSYPHETVQGVSGFVDTDNNVYTWEIGEAPTASTAGELYSDKNDYVDLTVSLGKGDSMNGGIIFSASSVKEPNISGQANLNDTKRYLLVEPKYNGTFSITIAFTDAASHKKDRIYYADLGEDVDISSINLSDYNKGSHEKAGDDIITTNQATRTINMTAGHTYLVYTYQAGSTISDISYSYENTEPTMNPTTSPTIQPTELPTTVPSTVVPTKEPSIISIIERSVTGNAVDYKLQINTYKEEAILIASSYNEDGSLYMVKMTQLSNNTAEVSVNIPGENSNIKFMLWDSMESMKPVSVALEDKPAFVMPTATVPVMSSAPTDEPEESSVITLNKTTYPLVVGNANKTDFSDWETKGSTVQLEAYVHSDQYTAHDITWQSEDPSIATVSTSGKVQGRTTGFTRVYAMLPNGEKRSCAISVIDNITRSTVQMLELNTNELTIAEGGSAELIPIINPKDVYNNGALDISLTWSSSDESVVKVDADGKLNAVSEGRAVIRAVSNDIGRSAECSVTVTSGVAAASIFAVNQDVFDMKVGEKQQLTAESDSEIIWKSDNSFIADVDENGVVTAYSNSNIPMLADNPNYISDSTSAVSAPEKTIVFENGKSQYNIGTVKIYATAKDGGLVEVYEIRVADADEAVQEVTVCEEKLNIAKGNTKTITAAIIPAKLMDKRVTWSSSDESVAKIVDTGLTVYELCSAEITGVGAGEAVITAECEGVKSSCTVTVTDNIVKVDSINITNAKDIALDEVHGLNVEITSDAENQDIVWISTDSDKVSVNNEGIIQGLKSGSAVIYAIAADSVSDRELIDRLRDTRTIGENNEELNLLLDGAVYASCKINVEESSPYLHNLHIEEETVMEDSINILWNRASLLDTSNWKGYEVYCNDKLIDTVTTLGYTVNDLLPQTDYTFEVRAVDSDGDVLASETVSATTKTESPVINVLDYGAKGNGRVLDTYAIQSAINDCPTGGTVYLPKGYVFYSGALFLKSDMIFKVDGMLIGSTDSKDYPFIVTRWEGWRKVNQTGEEWANTTLELPDNHYAHSSLINAGTYDEGQNSHTGPYNIKNLVICGKGQINANGFKLGYNEGPNQKADNGGIPYPATPAVDPTIRGRAITIHNGQNIYIKDVQVAYSPSWNIHTIYCDNVTFDNLEVVSKGNGVTGAADNICILNGDGIDPDSSTNVNIFNCYFYTGDDAVAVKSGRNKEGNELDKPTAFLRITDCESNGSKGGFAVGSENASGVRNVLMQNLKIRNITLSDGIWFKTYWSRGGVTENIQIKDIDSEKPVQFAMNYATSTNNPADEVPVYRYIALENINTKLEFYGLKKESSHDETYINNVTIRGCSRGNIDYGRDFYIWDVNQVQWALSNTTNINFYKTGQFEDTELAFTGNAGMVREIDNANHTITVIDIATPADVKNEISSVLGGIQDYIFLNGNDIIYDSTILTDGNMLRVISQDGAYTADYTILTTQSDVAYDDTGIRINGNAEYVVMTTESNICVYSGATVEQIKTDIGSIYGFEQTYIISENGTELSDSNTVNDDCILTVISPNGEHSKDYNITIALLWNFSEYTTEVNTIESDFVEEYNGLKITISDNGADLDHDKITTDGVYWRGGASSGESSRYIEYTPEINGRLEVKGRIAKSDGRWGISTSKLVNSLKADSSSSTSTEFTTVYIECSAGTTYYVIDKLRGAYISQIRFIPEF